MPRPKLEAHSGSTSCEPRSSVDVADPRLADSRRGDHLAVDPDTFSDRRAELVPDTQQSHIAGTLGAVAEVLADGGVDRSECSDERLVDEGLQALASHLPVEACDDELAHTELPEQFGPGGEGRQQLRHPAGSQDGERVRIERQDGVTAADERGVPVVDPIEVPDRHAPRARPESIGCSMSSGGRADATQLRRGNNGETSERLFDSIVEWDVSEPGHTDLPCSFLLGTARDAGPAFALS